MNQETLDDPKKFNNASSGRSSLAWYCEPEADAARHPAPSSKSDIVIAADEDAASTPAATGTQDSAKMTKAPDSQNNSGQTTNTQAKSDKMTAEPSTPK